jgi:hypothetical protein
MLIALGCLQLAACSLSPVPITSAGGKQSDDRLLGLWQYIFEGSAQEKIQFVSIEKNDKGDLISQALYEDGRPQDEGDSRVVVARLGNERYVSVTHTDPDVRELYALIRYEFSDADHFVLYAPDLEQLKAATDSKLIAGKWVEDRHMSHIQLDASEKELRAFVIAHGKRIFSVKTLEFERTKQLSGPETTPPRP